MPSLKRRLEALERRLETLQKQRAAEDRRLAMAEPWREIGAAATGPLVRMPVEHPAIFAQLQLREAWTSYRGICAVNDEKRLVPPADYAPGLPIESRLTRWRYWDSEEIRQPREDLLKAYEAFRQAYR
jgi:hypothetical protein